MMLRTKKMFTMKVPDMIVDRLLPHTCYFPHVDDHVTIFSLFLFADFGACSSGVQHQSFNYLVVTTQNVLNKQ